MSARIKKDLKNLRTEWALTILLTIAPILIARLMGVTAREFILGHFAFLAICTAWIGAAAFGKDLSIGALSFSFAQLECRHLLWKEKVQTIGGIALALFLASFFSLGFLMEPVAPGQAPWSIGSTSLMPLAFLGITLR